MGKYSIISDSPEWIEMTESNGKIGEKVLQNYEKSVCFGGNPDF